MKENGNDYLRHQELGFSCGTVKGAPYRGFILILGGLESVVVFRASECSNWEGYFRWTLHPVAVTIRDNQDYFGVLLLFLLDRRVGGPPTKYPLRTS